jgi:hypothetical protein
MLSSIVTLRLVGSLGLYLRHILTPEARAPMPTSREL